MVPPAIFLSMNGSRDISLKNEHYHEIQVRPHIPPQPLLLPVRNFLFFFFCTLLLFIESSCIRTNNKFKNLNYNKYFLNSCIIFPTVLCLNGPNNLFAGLVGPFAGDGNGC